MTKIYVNTMSVHTAKSDMNTALFILQNNGIRLTAINSNALMFKTNNCEVRFIPMTCLTTNWIRGRRCDIAFYFPELIALSLTGHRDGNASKGKNLVQIIMDIEKGNTNVR